MIKLKNYCSLIAGLLLTTISYAASPVIIPAYSPSQYDAAIKHIYQTSLKKTNLSAAERITKVSAIFLNKPYSLGGLGEGETGQFDQDPLYRTDSFDCVTYVETVMALAVSNNLAEFQRNIDKIRYQNGEVAYVKRNHFTSVDWNPNNQAQGYIKDITASLGAPLQVASVLINKPNWYRFKQLTDLRLIHPISNVEANQLLQQWRHAEVTSVISHVDYIPLNALFVTQENQIIRQQAIFDRIPSGAIIEIVVKNSNTKNKIGTDLNVLHMGLAIRTKEGLMFREASEIYNKVVDVSLIEYLAKRYRYGGDPLHQGIHIEVITKPQINNSLTKK